MFSLIAAVATDGAIGQDGGLPWGHIPLDMRWFHAITTSAFPHAFAEMIIGNPDAYLLSEATLRPRILRNVCIMGRRTYDSLPSRKTETKLPGREILVMNHHDLTSLDDALVLAEKECDSSNVFVCGGAQVYADALVHPLFDYLFLTEIKHSYVNADAWWPVPLTSMYWREGVFRTRLHTGKPVISNISRKDGHHPIWVRTHASRWIRDGSHPYLRFGIWRKIHKEDLDA